MYLLIIYFPLISFLILGIFGRYLGVHGSNFIASLCIFLNMLLSYFIFYEVVLCGSICFFKLFSWFNIGLLNVYWGFFFDPITCSMLILVNTISFFVHLYSIDYMRYDLFSTRFMAYLSLFTFFMIILITADNFLQLFVGWEGVGLVSYLLIGFWFTILEANKSALKAILMNRLGDIGIVLAICLIFFQFRTLDFSIIFPIIYFFNNNYIIFCGFTIKVLTLIGIFILIGAIGKSAQFGLHTWLPDAMAGPTPVSALIHAATMVTAGVFVLIRISPILEYSNTCLTLIAIVGAITAFFASTIGLFQYDIKKIIAYSTCSQLGYMVLICGLSNYSLSLFHLINHGFFKALLFLSAGSIIHAMGDEQDIRRYGGLVKLLPFSYVMLLIGSFSLMGMPFLTGFYSKDIIIEVAYASYNFTSYFIYWLSLLSALFTAYYSTRLIVFTFLTKSNGFQINYKHITDSSIFIFISLMFLAINSIFFGFINRDLFIGLGVDTWLNSLNTNRVKNIIIEAEFLPYFIKIAPVIYSLCGIFIVFFVNFFFFEYYNKIEIKLSKKNKNNILFFIKFFINKWYIDVIYNKIILKVFRIISYNYIKNIDRGFVELIGPLGIVRSIYFLILKINFLQTGLIYNYIFVFIVSIIFMFLFFFFNWLTFDIEYIFLFIFIWCFNISKNHV